MSEEKFNKDAVMDGFDQSWFANTAANEGGGYARHPIGDFRFRVRDIDQKASQGDKPHVMLVFEFETVAAHAGSDASAIGSVRTERYGGTKSPPFMQKRTKNLLDALGVRGPWRPKEIVGKEFDGTIYWEVGDPQISETGEERVYVNDRMMAERSVGATKSKNANAQLKSAAALKHLKDQGELAEDDDGTSGAAATNASSAATTSAAASSAATSTSTPAWIDEAQIAGNKQVHVYRAVAAIGGPKADEARKGLIAKRINPDGPIDVTKLEGDVKTAYEAHVAKQQAAGDDGLPDLDVAGDANGQAPAAAARTGTRRKPQPSA